MALSAGSLGENVNIGDPQAFANETTTRLQNIEGRAGAFDIKIAALEIGVSSQTEKVAALELGFISQNDQNVRVEAGINDAFQRVAELQEALQILNLEVISIIIDEKIKTAGEIYGKGGGKDDRGSQGFEFRGPILESKAINDLPELSDARTYREWSQRFKNAMEQVRPNTSGWVQHSLRV